MILGVGTDIIEVSRIKASYEKFGERFLNRILRPAEIQYCLSNKVPAPFLAVRFAAKEAVSKAFGTGIGKYLGWQDIEVGKMESGQPYVILYDKGLALFQERKGGQFHLSLSHTENYASAVAILDGQPR